MHKTDFSYRTLTSIIFLLIATIFLVLKLSHKPTTPVSAAWFDDTYTYRQLIAVTHNAFLTNRAIGVSVSTSGLISAGKMQSDCDDSRFTDPNGTVLIYEYVSGCNTPNTQYTVVFPTVYSSTNYIYIYYGNPTATSASQTTTSYTSLTPSTPGPVASTEEQGGGPIGFWKLDEGIGTTAYDIAKNNNMILTNGPTWQASPNCKSDNCISFDGSNDYIINNGVGSSFNTANPFTWSLWIYLTRATNSDVIGEISSSTTCNDNPQIWISSSDSKLKLGRCGNGNGPSIDTASNLLNQWHHISFTYDGTTTYSYLNGNLIDSYTFSWPSITSPRLVMGASRNFTSLSQGRLDDIKLYSYARSAAQVKSDYNSYGQIKGSSVNLSIAYTGTNAPPLAYWNFEEGVGTSIYDVGTSSFNGSLATGTSAPVWTIGKNGKGLYFDGNDYLTVADNSALNLASAITIETWINPTSSLQGSAVFVKKTNGNSGYALEGSSPTLWLHIGGIWRNSGGAGSINLNEWTHLTGTYDGSTIKIYKNGILMNSTAQSGSITSPTGGVLGMGRDPANPTDNTRFYTGLQDEVRIYNYARTQKQIMEDINNGHVAPMIAWFKLNEGVGTSTYNSGTYGNTIRGTLNNISSPATSTSGWTNSGVSSKALSFDGINDTVDFTCGSFFNFSDVSMSAWIKTTTNSRLISQFQNGTPLIYMNVGAGPGGGTNKKFSASIRTDGNTLLTATGTTNIDDGNWHHVAFSRSTSTQLISVYVDGKLEGTTTLSDTSNISASGSICRLGHDSTYAYNGQIDDFKVYSYALTSSEVAIDYNQSQSLYLGSVSSDIGGTSFSNSTSRSYCVPGDTTTCDSPVAEWLFEEGVGTTAYDTSGNAFNATLGTGTSTPVWVSGNGGKALLFDGGDYISATTSTTINGSYTVNLWIKPSSISTQTIFSTRYPTEFGMDIQLTTTGLHADIGNGSSSFYTTAADATVTIPTTSWTNVVYVVTSTTWTIYINGKPTANGSYGAGTPVLFDTNHRATIGYEALYGGGFYTGYVDNIKIYNYARTPAQIAWEYNQGKPIVHFKFDECQGPTTFDSMGTGITGTWSGSGAGSQTSIGSCTTNASTPRYTGRDGKFNSSLNFDGTDDYININNTSNIDLANKTFSISSWTKTNDPSPATDGEDTIIEKNWFGGIPQGWIFSINSSGYIQFKIGNGTTIVTCQSTKSINDNIWHHVVVTNDGSNINIYLDSNLVSTCSNTNLNSTNSYPAGIGGRARSPAFFWNGQIDDLKIFSYPLTATQVKTLYNNGALNFSPVTGAP